MKELEEATSFFFFAFFLSNPRLARTGDGRSAQVNLISRCSGDLNFT